MTITITLHGVLVLAGWIAAAGVVGFIGFAVGVYLAAPRWP